MKFLRTFLKLHSAGKPVEAGGIEKYLLFPQATVRFNRYLVRQYSNSDDCRNPGQKGGRRVCMIYNVRLTRVSRQIWMPLSIEPHRNYLQ